MLALVLLLAPITWIHDDYGAAVAQAKAMKRPLVVDLWAPWCHTCLSMKSTVLVDPAITAQADDFVWLAIDTDRPQNAEALKRLKPGAWPTFYVVDPTDGAIRARHVGSATVAEFKAFLGAGRTAASPIDVQARAGDAAAAAGDYPKALELYRGALKQAPAAWPRRVAVLVSAIGAMWKTQSWRPCAELGLAELGAVGANRSAAAADFSWYAHDCAQKTEDAALAAKVRAALLAPTAPLRQVLAAPENLTVDDHSDGLRILRELQDAAGDTAAARATAARQSALLAAAAGAGTPKDRMMLNWPRAEVAIYLGEGAALVPDLQKSVAELPEEYDPPYRLAWVLHQIKRHDEALAAAKKAEALVYGPRKGRVLGLIAAIHAARGDQAGERAAREAAVKVYSALTGGQRSEAALKAAQAALAALK